MRSLTFILSLLLSVTAVYAGDEIEIEGRVNYPHVWKPDLNEVKSLQRLLIESKGCNVFAYYLIVVRNTDEGFQIYKFRTRNIEDGVHQNFRLRLGDYVWIRSRESALNTEQGLKMLPDKIKLMIENSKKGYEMFIFSKQRKTTKQAQQVVAPDGE